uniref:Uncharacterized protein n=1 Tax=Anguilla anguilla TaxID=7936 RepID=A0A0E9Q510_ANGAN
MEANQTLSYGLHTVLLPRNNGESVSFLPEKQDEQQPELWKSQAAFSSRLKAAGQPQLRCTVGNH